MKDFRSVLQNYLNKHDRRKKQLAAVVSMSMLISFTVPLVLTEPAFSQTKNSPKTSGSFLSTQLFNAASDYMVSNLNNGQDGNNGYSKGSLTEGELLIGSGSELYADSAAEVITNARNKYFLGIASDFCIFLEGDFKPSNSDSEGRVAVGGNIIFSNDWNYQVGSGNFGYMTALKDTDDYVGTENFAHAIAGGYIKNINLVGTGDPGARDITNGKFGTNALYFPEDEDLYKRIVVGTNFLNETDANHKYCSTTNHNAPYTTNGKHDEIVVNEYAGIYPAQLIDFTDSFAYIKEQSMKLSKITATGTVRIEGDSIYFTAPENSENANNIYFNIDELNLDSNTKKWKLYFENIPKATTTMIVREGGDLYDKTKDSPLTEISKNVPDCNIIVNCGGESFHIDAGDNLVQTFIKYIGESEYDEISNDNPKEEQPRGWRTNNHPASSKILYNFYEATVGFIDTNFNGTILSPYANVTSNADCQGHLSGSLIAQSFEGGMEFGYRPYRGTIDILPSTSGYGVPIRKIISGTTDTGLAGATFGIYKVADGELSLESTFKSDKNGNGYVNIPSAVKFDGSEEYVLDQTLSNDYIIKEIEAPAGFVLDSNTKWEISVTEKIKNIEKINETDIPTQVETNVIIKNNAGETTDRFSIDSKDSYTIDGKHEMRYLAVTKDDILELTEYFIMEMDNGSIKEVYKTDGEPPVSSEITVTSVVTSMSTSSYNGTATTLDANGNPVTDVKISVVYPTTTAPVAGASGYNISQIEGFGNYTGNDINVKKATFYYSNKEPLVFENIVYSNGNWNFLNAFSLTDDQKKNVVGIEFVFEDQYDLSNVKVQGNRGNDWNASMSSPSSSNDGKTWSFGDVPEEGEEETTTTQETTTTTSIVILESWYVTVPTTIYVDVPVTSYVDVASYIDVYSTATIPDLYNSSNGFKDNTTFTTAVEGYPNSSRSYQLAPSNKMIMPLPTQAPTFENDYGLNFKKISKSGNDIEPLKNAEIAIKKADDDAIIATNILKGDSSATIDLKDIENDVIYYFEETAAPDGYETAGKIYFKKSGTTITYADNADLNDPKTIELTNNGTNEAQAIEMIDIKISGAVFKLEKIDANTKEKLANSEFKLYIKKGTDELVYPIDDSTFKIPATGMDLYDEFINNPDKVNADYVKDGYLVPGLYYLEETTPPDDYKVADGFEFRVKKEGDSYIIEPVAIGTVAYSTDAKVENSGSDNVYIYPADENGNKINSLPNVVKIEIILDNPAGTSIDIWDIGDGDTIKENVKKIKLENGISANGEWGVKATLSQSQTITLEFNGSINFERLKLNNSGLSADNVKEVRIYCDDNSSSGDSGDSGGSTDTGAYTVDCLYFMEAWGTNAIEEMTVYYANGETSTLNQRVALNDDTANFVRITSGDGISLNHTSRDNIVGMKIKMSSNNRFKLAIENGDWSSTLWGYDGSEWLPGDRTLEIGDTSGKNREESAVNNLESDVINTVEAQALVEEIPVVASVGTRVLKLSDIRASKSGTIQELNVTRNGVDVLAAGSYPAGVTVTETAIIINSLNFGNLSDNDVYVTFTVNTPNDRFGWGNGYIKVNNNQNTNMSIGGFTNSYSSETVNCSITVSDMKRYANEGNSFEFGLWNNSTFSNVDFKVSDGSSTGGEQTSATQPATPSETTTIATTVATAATTAAPSGLQAEVVTDDKGNITLQLPNEKAGEEMKVTVEKKWADDTGFEDLRASEIEVKLERYLADGTTKDDSFSVDNVKLNSSNRWKASWEKLERHYYDENHEEKTYVYKVTEITNIDNYNPPKYSPDNKLSADGTIKITNTLNTIDITAKKNWQDGSGNVITNNSLLPAEVQVKLQYKKDNTWTDVKDGTYTLTASDSWTTTIEKLPAIYEYRIVELNIPNGWTMIDNTDTAKSGDLNASITNKQQVGSLEISKNWKDDESKNRPDSITVALYRSTQKPASAASTVITPDLDYDNYSNYAKALQYSLYFYDANMCGSQVGETSAYSWRDDCHVEGGIINGGFHDAGDHTMFGLPQGFTASTLGWSYYEFKEAYDSLGQTDHYKTIMKYFCDFFEQCIRDDNGTTKVLVQRGQPGVDQKMWAPPEGKSCSDYGGEEWVSSGSANIAAEYAASLASYVANFPDDNNNYLVKAEQLYNYAKAYCSQGGHNYNDVPDGECQSEMAWAAVWLYLATGNNTYKTDCASYLNGLSIPSIGYFYSNVAAGAMILYGAIDDSYNLSTLKTYLDNNCNNNSYKILDAWGSARHNTLLQTIALSATKNFDDVDYTDWCANQMSMILGKNDGNICLITGFSDNSVKYPHHRAASGGNQNNANYTYKLVGALAGGPGGTSFANYPDDVGNYTENEVTLDYNAGLTGAAAGLYYLTGKGETDSAENLMAASDNKLRKTYDETPVNVTTFEELPIERKTGDNKGSGLLNIGDERKLILSNLTDGETVTWEVINPNALTVATIDDDNILTIVEDGTATITAKIDDEVVAEYDLTVQLTPVSPDVSGMERVKNIQLKPDSWSATEGNLPIYSPDGKKYYYYIKEVGTTATDDTVKGNGCTYYPISYTSNGVELSNGTPKIEVTNKKSDNGGIMLPTTGGTGTRNYYIFGACLICIAGVLLIKRRKRITE